MATNFPNEEEALELFKKAQETMPQVPIVGCWKQGEFTNLARFISFGLHSHLMRDIEGDYVFLLPSMMEAAQAAAIAQRSRVHYTFALLVGGQRLHRLRIARHLHLVAIRRRHEGTRILGNPSMNGV